VRALRSALLDEHRFAHGFSLRSGGVSEGRYASLNLGRSVGDDPEHVAENARRFAGEIAVDLDRLYEASQVHGRGVVDARGPITEVRKREADALVSMDAGVGVGVRTADCVPILIADPRTGVVSAVHAGWRGLVAYVIAAAVQRMHEQGAQPGDLVAAIGPHIRAESFEVGKDVASEIASAAHGVDVIVSRGARPHVDLAKVVVAQLVHAGIAKERIDDIGGDTFADAERFFSHRRDAGDTGRHLSAIAAR
jgi:polyphenol oxidase